MEVERRLEVRESIWRMCFWVPRGIFWERKEVEGRGGVRERSVEGRGERVKWSFWMRRARVV